VTRRRRSSVPLICGDAHDVRRDVLRPTSSVLEDRCTSCGVVGAGKNGPSPGSWGRDEVGPGRQFDPVLDTLPPWSTPRPPREDVLLWLPVSRIGFRPVCPALVFQLSELHVPHRVLPWPACPRPRVPMGDIETREAGRARALTARSRCSGPPGRPATRTAPTSGEVGRSRPLRPAGARPDQGSPPSPERAATRTRSTVSVVCPFA
jgi:hypothetical protein